MAILLNLENLVKSNQDIYRCDSLLKELPVRFFYITYVGLLRILLINGVCVCMDHDEHLFLGTPN